MNDSIKGFYYHYKRDPNSAFNQDAYEVIGTAFNTESGGAVHSDDSSDFLKDEVVIYRPLFESALVYKNNKRFWTRPLKMFTDTLTKDDKTFPRFQKITDTKIIAELEKIRDSMYESK